MKINCKNDTINLEKQHLLVSPGKCITCHLPPFRPLQILYTDLVKSECLQLIFQPTLKDLTFYWSSKEKLIFS